MKINLLWDFGEAVDNIRTIREQYEELLSSFSIYELKQKGMLIKAIRDKIYQLNIFEWQKDKLWEYMNGDIPYIILKGLGNRQKPN